MLQQSYKMFEYKESSETNVWRWQELSITPVYVTREAQQYHAVKTTSSVYKKMQFDSMKRGQRQAPHEEDSSFKETQSQRRFVEPKKMQPVMEPVKQWVQDVTSTTKNKNTSPEKK